MKKVFFSSVLISTLVLSTMGLTVNAEEIKDGSATTKASVGVTGVTDEDVPEIVDPEANPDGDITGHAGQFTIDQVPNFDFGSTTISGGTIKLDKTKKTAVQVSDRRSIGSGWTLSVALSDFKNTDESKTGKEATLKGVSMKMNVIDLTSNPGNMNKEPNKNTVELSAGGSSDALLTAEADTNEVSGIGRGSWMGKFSDGVSDTETSLFIPGGNYEGQYSADLVWTFSQTI